MTTKYIIRKQMQSDKALRIMGNGNIWKPVVSTSSRPPTDEHGFHEWLWSLVQIYGPGKYSIIRSHSKGEKRGYKKMCICSITSTDLEIERSYSGIKSHPGFKANQQAFFKRISTRRRFGRGIPIDKL